MSIGKIRRSVLVTAGIGVIAVAGLFAGRLSAGAFSHGRADFAGRIFGHIARALDLTDDQKTQIKTILQNHAAEIKTQMQASGAARRALHDAVMAQPVDESAIRAAAVQVGQTQGDGAVLLAKIRTEVEPILTADQKLKIQSFKSKMRNHADAAARSFDQFLRSGS